MERREFIRHLALLAAGVAALPEQILAFERLYTVNAPPAHVTKGLIAVKDVYLGGLAERSTPVIADFFTTKGQPNIRLALNLFGGVVRWVGAPDCPLRVASFEEFHWEITMMTPREEPLSGQDVTGHVMYLDQDGLIHTELINVPCGSLSGRGSPLTSGREGL
jgi:hypothetical protein